MTRFLLCLPTGCNEPRSVVDHIAKLLCTYRLRGALLLAWAWPVSYTGCSPVFSTQDKEHFPKCWNKAWFAHFQAHLSPPPRQQRVWCPLTVPHTSGCYKAQLEFQWTWCYCWCSTQPAENAAWFIYLFPNKLLKQAPRRAVPALLGSQLLAAGECQHGGDDAGTFRRRFWQEQPRRAQLWPSPRSWLVFSCQTSHGKLLFLTVHLVNFLAPVGEGENNHIFLLYQGKDFQSTDFNQEGRINHVTNIFGCHGKPQIMSVEEGEGQRGQENINIDNYKS